MEKTRHIGILGYAVEGQAVAAYLYAQGYERVTIFDEKLVVAKEPYPVVTGPHAFDQCLDCDILFRTPGLSLNRPILQIAKKKGCHITSQTELFFSLCQGITIGITGTKGKTTTASFLHHLLLLAGKKSVLVGNIGVQMLTQLPEIDASTYVVMELSSFQLHALPVSPHIAIVLGITPEHLDYHANMEEYIEAKKSIVAHQGVSDIAVLDYDNAISRELGNDARGMTLEVCKNTVVGYGVGVQDGRVVFCEDGTYEALCNVDALPARAPELQTNFLMGLAVGYILGITPEVMQQALQTFLGVPYRMECVGSKHGVTFWNDSAGTTPESAIAAIHSFSEPMMILLGGGEKHVSFDGLVDTLCASRHVHHVVTIGKMAGERIAQALRARGEHHFEHTHLDTYTELPQLFTRVCSEGTVKHIVLSPACSSFDLFQNYKERGDTFVEIVQNL